jgi:hypothetical protein
MTPDQPDQSDSGYRVIIIMNEIEIRREANPFRALLRYGVLSLSGIK